MTDGPAESTDNHRRGTGRLEAFSDGVFAIAIPLLVLELVVPSKEEAVGRELIEQWPMYMAYLVSFATIGAAWVVHSTITGRLERVDAVLLRLNLLLLFFVSVLPFPTKMLAEYAGSIDEERIAVVIYGINLFAISGMTSIVWRHASAEGLIEDAGAEVDVRAVTATLTPSLVLYAAAIVVGLLAPRVALFLYLVIALYKLIPFRTIFRHVGRRTAA